MGGSFGKDSSKSRSSSEPGFNQLDSGMTGAPRALMDFLGKRIGQKFAPYGGNFAAGLTPMEQRLQRELFANPIGEDFGAGDQLAKTLGGEFLGSNPYLDESVAGATGRLTEDFESTVLPGLENAALSAGSVYSSRYPESVNDAGRILSDEIGDVSSRMYSGAYESERDRQIGAAGLAPGVSDIPYNQALAAQPLAGLERTQVLNPNLQGKYGEFLRGEDQIFQIAQAISNLLASSLGGTASESSSSGSGFRVAGGFGGGTN